LLLVFARSTSYVFTTDVIVGCDEAVLKIISTFVGIGNKLGMSWWRWMESHVWMEPLQVLVGWMSISLDWNPFIHCRLDIIQTEGHVDQLLSPSWKSIFMNGSMNLFSLWSEP